MSIIGERRKYFKKEAKFFLRYNYLKQIFMTAVIILITFGLNAIKANVIKLFGLDYSLYSAPLGMFFDLLAFFITIPLYIGIIYVNIKLFEGETVPVSGMFHYFSSSANLFDCYKFIISMTGRIAAFAVPFLVFGAIFSKLRSMFEIILAGTVSVDSVITVDIVMVCACVIYISAFAACVVFFMRYFAAVFIFVKNPCLNMRDIIQKSAKLMKKRKTEALKLAVSFTVWILISHYFAGFLYVFFTMPYIMLSYTSFLSYLLAENGGNCFLSAAGDYIDEISEISRMSEITEITGKFEKVSIVKNDIIDSIDLIDLEDITDISMQKTGTIDKIYKTDSNNSTNITDNYDIDSDSIEELIQDNYNGSDDEEESDGSDEYCEYEYDNDKYGYYNNNYEIDGIDGVDNGIAESNKRMFRFLGGIRKKQKNSKLR